MKTIFALGSNGDISSGKEFIRNRPADVRTLDNTTYAQLSVFVHSVITKFAMVLPCSLCAVVAKFPTTGKWFNLIGIFPLFPQVEIRLSDTLPQMYVPVVSV